MEIEKNVEDAIQTYVEMALHVYGVAYGSAIANKIPEDQAWGFAREILRSFLQPKQEKVDPILAQKIAWLTSGRNVQ